MEGISTDEQKKHIVLVHGACHGAWCWFKLKPLIEAAGHRVSAFDLSAAGTNTKEIQQVITFADYTAPLLEFMAAIPPEEKVVLVGHSVGGLCIALAMEKYPKKISLAVFLTAFMPDTANRPSYVFDQFYESIPKEDWLDTSFLPYTNDQNESDIKLLFGQKFLSLNMYQLCSDEDRELVKILARPIPLFLNDLPKAQPYTEEAYGSVKRAYILCDEDKTIKEEFQRWMIKNNPVVEMKELKGVDHMPMISDPKQLSTCLLDLARGYD
uniref:salicylic acid-binding protein 2-like isoform X2 n=1 Tax=Erigeron canadensis TaxID=72917 RepID=UPI001CB8A161|nr:salicylic acid-binding protein 2-like isoform X2 [Erigeron canadensis]